MNVPYWAGLGLAVLSVLWLTWILAVISIYGVLLGWRVLREPVLGLVRWGRRQVRRCGESLARCRAYLRHRWIAYCRHVVEYADAEAEMPKLAQHGAFLLYLDVEDHPLPKEKGRKG